VHAPARSQPPCPTLTRAAHPLPPFPLPRFDTYHPLEFSLAAALGTPAPTVEALEAFAPNVSLLARRELMGADAKTLLGLHELLAYGLRGVAAYAHHAEMLGQVDPSIDDVFEEVYSFLASSAASDAGAVLGMAMKLGEVNFRTMALLDKGHTTRCVRARWGWSLGAAAGRGGPPLTPAAPALGSHLHAHGS
jgi:hydroxylamine reductase